MITKQLLAISSSIILLVLITFPAGLQAGATYECKDKNGSITLSDVPLGKGYNCKPLESFRDVTNEDRKTWEKEKNLSNEKWEKDQAKEEKERIEGQKKEAEIEKEKRAEEILRAAQAAEAAAAAAPATSYGGEWRQDAKPRPRPVPRGR